MYLKVVGMVLFLLISFGIVLPFLFSAASDEAVVTGMLYVIVAIPVMCKLGKNIKTIIKEKLNEKN
jgi:Kef-type K+ transport system membrane component KefB